MDRKQVIESVDFLLRDICSRDELFGGKIVVFGGDFRQVLPVISRATPEKATENSLINSYIWQHLRKFHLKHNMRSVNDL